MRKAVLFSTFPGALCSVYWRSSRLRHLHVERQLARSVRASNVEDGIRTIGNCTVIESWFI